MRTITGLLRYPTNFLCIALYGVMTGLLFSCGERSLHPESYLTYCSDEDNGLVGINAYGNRIYSVQYRSAELMSLIESQGQTLSNEAFQEIVEEYKGMQYYLFRIRQTGPERIAVSDTSTIEDQFPFDFQSKISLIQHADTLQPDLYHFENGLSQSGEYRFLLGFEGEIKGDPTIQVRDPYSNKTHIFPFLASDIRSIPQLDYD